MLKERANFVRTILYFTDLTIVSIIFFATYYYFSVAKLVYQGDLFPGIEVVKTPASIDEYLKAFFLALLLWAALFRLRGLYYLRVQTYSKMIGVLIVNGFIFFGIFSSAAFLLKFDFLSRFFVISYTFFCVFLIFLNRVAVLGIAYFARSRGYNYRNILLVGTGKRTIDFIEMIARHKEWGYRIVGLLDWEEGRVGQAVEGYPIIGELKNIQSFLENSVIDEVVFIVPRTLLKEIEKSIIYCESVGVPATLSTDFFDLEIARGVPKEMDGNTFLTFETRRLQDPELLVKRVFDISLSLAVLALTSPIFIAIIFFAKLTSRGPVFFKQVRCGKNGREFILYKFRSMIEGAEEKLQELKGKNEMTGPVFKMENDPRTTRFGKFLRKTSLDEFPQFWNVLKGDMSFVGPRPPLPDEVKKYEPWQRRRLSMKPGITCLWQVSGRNQIDFESWMKLDLKYIDNWSLWLDIKIFFKTFWVVLTGRGAK